MNLFRKLLTEAQFHGARRLTERKHYRRYWAVALALSFWASCSIIAVTTTRFTTNPTYVVIEETNNMSHKFPSVIVCPEVLYPYYKIDEFLATLYPPSMNISVIRPIIRQLAAFYSPDVEFTIKDLKTIEELLKFNLIGVETATRRLTATCEETVLRCRLFGKMVNCTSLFHLELASFGYCCVSNGRSLKREIQAHGIQKTVSPPDLYTSSSGHDSGLMIVVNSSQETGDIDLTYKWFYLKSGQQFVEVGENGTAISPNKEYWAVYKNKKFLLDEDVRGLSREMRRCRMSTEKLQFFPKYSRSSCMIECEMIRTMRRCLCVKLSYPRRPFWNTCDADKLLCLKNSAVPYESNACDCPLTCDSVTDFTSITSFQLVQGDHNNDHFYYGFNFSQVTVVRAFILRDASRQLYARRSYYRAIIFFSQIGGTLNVFFGWSILTVLELLQLALYGYRQYMTVKAQPQKTRTDRHPSDGKKNKKKKKKAVKFRK